MKSRTMRARWGGVPVDDQHDLAAVGVLGQAFEEASIPAYQGRQLALAA